VARKFYIIGLHIPVENNPDRYHKKVPVIPYTNSTSKNVIPLIKCARNYITLTTQTTTSYSRFYCGFVKTFRPGVLSAAVQDCVGGAIRNCSID